MVKGGVDNRKYRQKSTRRRRFAGNRWYINFDVAQVLENLLQKVESQLDEPAIDASSRSQSTTKLCI